MIIGWYYQVFIHIHLTNLTDSSTGLSTDTAEQTTSDSSSITSFDSRHITDKSSGISNTLMIESFETNIDSVNPISTTVLPALVTTENDKTSQLPPANHIYSTAVAKYSTYDTIIPTSSNEITTYAVIYEEGMLPCSIVPLWYSIRYTIRPIDDKYSIVYECENGYEFADEYVRRYSVCSEKLIWQPPISVCRRKYKYFSLS